MAAFSSRDEQPLGGMANIPKEVGLLRILLWTLEADWLME